MDALDFEKAILAGYDWGVRTANIIAALWPERCKALVSVSGYLIGSRESASGSATGLCRSCRRSRRSLIGVSLRVGRATSSRSASPP